MPYCMYLRKSRADLEAEARGEGETLARHFQTLTLLAARLNLYVPPDAVYREIVSGDTIAARPMMQRLLQEVTDGKWEGVLCTEVERLARGDTIDQGMVANAFKFSGTKIITPTKTYDPENEMDEEYFEFSLFMARREYKAIKRRMQAGRAASVREGHYVGGKRPFGYEVIKCKGEKGYTLQQVPEEARIVRLVFDMYLNQGMGTANIAHRLTALGSTTYNGHEWNTSNVRYMLKQPVYAGYVQWLKRESRPARNADGGITKRPFSERYILAKGKYEPIVSEEDFQRVQAVAASRRTIAQVQNQHITNPLAGLCKCALCCYAMVRRPNVNGVFLTCKTPSCKNSSIQFDVALAAVLDGLRAWVDQYDGAAPSPSVPAVPGRAGSSPRRAGYRPPPAHHRHGDAGAPRLLRGRIPGAPRRPPAEDHRRPGRNRPSGIGCPHPGHRRRHHPRPPPDSPRPGRLALRRHPRRSKRPPPLHPPPHRLQEIRPPPP